ncbi:uncharacterized protein LOC132549132 [Ylistrum balloti]|uniref:uncharacterized protein LOC132549132 n=1 Tax=Ylistrum balloti TaxID=509963 RepID=UPI00290589A5|nr:uncharacterized protein LOC132549132 [Ylistrum balloti]
MDRSYLSRRRVRPENTNPSKVGGCDFCYQKNIKIRPLQCQNHFYCQVCEEFCPKIRKGDFTCRKCSHRTRQLDDENRKRVDDFYVKQEGLAKPKGFEEVIISIDGSNIISFDGDDDEEDLSGNNTEWDFLLQSLTSKERKKNNKESEKVLGSKKSKPDECESEKRKGIKKKKHKVDLVFPKLHTSPNTCSGGSDESTSSLDQLGITGLAIKLEEEHPSSTLELASISVQDSPPIIARTIQLLPDQEGIRAEECLNTDSLSERGTSPVKQPPKMLDAASWLGLRKSSEDSNHPIELYNIEGPSFRERNASSGGSIGSAFERDLLQNDDFWDF